jgi:hypothetical protein
MATGVAATNARSEAAAVVLMKCMLLAELDDESGGCVQMA